jgi:hypothetical protein
MYLSPHFLGLIIISEGVGNPFHGNFPGLFRLPLAQAHILETVVHVQTIIAKFLPLALHAQLLVNMLRNFVQLPLQAFVAKNILGVITLAISPPMLNSR